MHIIYFKQKLYTVVFILVWFPHVKYCIRQQRVLLSNMSNILHACSGGIKHCSCGIKYFASLFRWHQTLFRWHQIFCKLVQVTLNIVQVTSNMFRWHQTCSGGIKCFASLFRWHQTCPGGIKNWLRSICQQGSLQPNTARPNFATSRCHTVSIAL